MNGIEKQPTERAIAGARAFAECNSTTEEGEERSRRDRVGREETPRVRDEEGENFKREREDATRVYVSGMCVCVK